jgi:hypothetical protein
MTDLTISEAATAAGCTDHELRVWSFRYGWPNPHRSASGYRLYSPALVELIRRVVVARNSGVMIGCLLGSGSPVFPATMVPAGPPRARLLIDLAGVPDPQREDGRDLALFLLSAVGRGSTAAEVRHIAEVRISRVHPGDRPAILALVERIEQQAAA